MSSVADSAWLTSCVTALGHSGIAITLDTYGHISPEVDQVAASRVAKLSVDPATRNAG